MLCSPTTTRHAMAAIVCTWLVLSPLGGMFAGVSVQQHTDEKSDKAVFTVSNGMYRVEWVQMRGATPTIARAWAGDDVPVGRLFQVSWGRAESGAFSVVESGPVRAVLAGEFRVKQTGKDGAIDIVRIRAEHWDGDPRIAIACDFVLGKKRTQWVLCSNYLRIGGEANHPDRWVASGKPEGGPLDPLTSAPVPGGKRWTFFDFMTPWGEVYRPEPPEKSAGVGAFTAKVRIPSGNWAVYDVIAGERLPTRPEEKGQAFTVDVERFGGTLIALCPSPVAKVEVSCDRVERGWPARWTVRILGPSRQPIDALQPVEVTVTDPKGRPSEYSGHYVARSGQLRLTPTIAVNDLPGRWEVEVKELASGVTGKTSFRVR